MQLIVLPQEPLRSGEAPHSLGGPTQETVGRPPTANCQLKLQSGCMASEQPPRGQSVHVRIELETGSQPVSGQLRVEDGQPLAFCGWMQLTSMINSALGPAGEGDR
jgi:hypothetical protein